ncbi:MAG: hypothetical protein RR413_05770 [Christensenellaceae bacterium]
MVQKQTCIKLFVVALISLTLILICYGTTQYNSKHRSKAKYTGTIKEITSTHAIILIDENCSLRTSGSLASANLSGYQKQFSVGDRVEVGYDGIVFYSHPLDIGADYIKKIA